MKYRIARIIGKSISFVITFFILSILFASAVLELWGKRVQDIETLHQIEKIERQRLKIHNDVKITFIFDNNWGIFDEYRKRGSFGLTYLNDETNKNIIICLRKPSFVYAMRHEIYHTYRFSHPKHLKRNHFKTREQFLAYVYGIWGINLEFLFND